MRFNFCFCGFFRISIQFLNGLKIVPQLKWMKGKLWYLSSSLSPSIHTPHDVVISDKSIIIIWQPTWQLWNCWLKTCLRYAPIHLTHRVFKNVWTWTKRKRSPLIFFFRRSRWAWTHLIYAFSVVWTWTCEWFNLGQFFAFPVG